MKENLENEKLYQQLDQDTKEFIESARVTLRDLFIKELPIRLGSISKEVSLVTYVNMKIHEAFMEGMLVLGKHFAKDFNIAMEGLDSGDEDDSESDDE